MLGGEPPSVLFNLRSATFRKSGIDPESLTEERMLDLLVEEPRYWKRPVAGSGGEVDCGCECETAWLGAGVLMGGSTGSPRTGHPTLRRRSTLTLALSPL